MEIGARRRQASGSAGGTPQRVEFV